jgi:4-amino-4-deoxy-L-arabinose transferase-like glycosyltransferase
MRAAGEVRLRAEGIRRREAAAALGGVAAITALAAIVRLVGLGSESFWYDEAFSAEIAARPAWALFSGIARDLGNPPLHPLLLHVWALAFGGSDASLRALSAAAGILTIPLVWLVGRRLASERAALLAAALLAASPLHVELSQEARAYALATLLGLASVLALLRAAERPRSHWRWVVYGAAVFGSLYAHYFAIFLLPGHLALLRSVRRPGAHVLGPCAATLALASVPYLLWLPAFLGQLRTPGNLARSSETWWLHLVATPLAFTSGTALAWKGPAPSRLGLALGAAAGIASTAAIAAAIRAARRGDRRARRALAWLGGAAAGPALFSAAVFPIYAVRYGLVLLPAFDLAVAIGLLALAPRLRHAALAALAAAAVASTAVAREAPRKADWRHAVPAVEAEATPADVVAFDADFQETAYLRYGTDRVPHLRALPAPAGAGVPLYGSAFRGDPPHDVSAQLRAASRVFLVLSDPAPGARARWKAALAGREIEEEREFFRIRVVRYGARRLQPAER